MMMTNYYAIGVIIPLIIVISSIHGVIDCELNSSSYYCIWVFGCFHLNRWECLWSSRKTKTFIYDRSHVCFCISHMVNFKWLIGSDEVNKKNRHTFSHMHSCFFYWINWEVTVGAIFSVFTRIKRVVFRICLFIVWLLLFCEKKIS